MTSHSKILLLFVSLSLITASIIYGYYSMRKIENDNTDYAKITALEALNATLEYMNSKYDSFNLTTIHEYSHTTLENMPDWKITYIIQNGEGITYEDVSVFSDFRINTITRTYLMDEVLSNYYPWDIRGVEHKLLQIDSDEAIGIIRQKIENETGCTYEYFSLHLECSLSVPGMPIWVGDYYSPNNGSYKVKVNAGSGDIVAHYAKFNKAGTYSDLSDVYTEFDGNNFTALEGLVISKYHIEQKYQTYNLSRIYSCTNETGKCDSWIYDFVISSATNEVIHETVTVYANGTFYWYNRIFDMYELRRGDIHGLVDIHGFDLGMLKIDSDEVMGMVETIAQNYSWWNDRTLSSLRLVTEDPYYYESTQPTWRVVYSGYREFIINATTGQLIRYYEN